MPSIYESLRTFSARLVKGIFPIFMVPRVVTEPLLRETVAEALVRASARVQEVRRQKKVSGQVLVFTGAKGGSGVTTVASNFALALAKEATGKVVLVDLDLQLGDAALTLGISSLCSPIAKSIS